MATATAQTTWQDDAARALLFRRLAPTGVPGVFKVELSIGDAADALTDDEVAALFARVMAG